MDATQGTGREHDEAAHDAETSGSVLFGRTIRGGFGGKTRESLTIDREGECRCTRVVVIGTNTN